MTKQELIEALEDFDDDIEILVDGYEDGYDKLRLAIKYIVESKDVKWYNGLYDDADENGKRVLVISRMGHE